MRSFKLSQFRFKNLVLGSLIAIFCISISASGANAQDMGGAQPRVPYDRALMARLPSTVDDVGVAFLKTAGNFPDFGTIVESSDAYKDLNPLAQKDYKAKMVNKLQNGFMTFTPKKSDLIIRMKVNVLFKKLPNGESTLKIRTFPNDPVYFPFYFAKYPIALIVNDMEMFRDLSLDKVDTDIVYSRLALSGDATLLLQLYPVAADDQKTVTLDNIPQYPFLAQIGYIGLLNRQSEQIWAWRNEKLTGKRVSGGDTRSLIDLVPADKQ